MNPGGPSRGAIFLAIAAATVGPLLVFLVGSLAPIIRADVPFDVATLGLLTGAFFATGAAASVPLGRVVHRVGPERSLRWSMAAAAAAFALVGASSSPWTIAVGAAVAGGAHAAVNPALNTFLVRQIPADKLGLAFGAKQSSAPAAMAIAGLTVPIASAFLGWRSVFGGLAVLVALVSWKISGSGRGSSTLTTRADAPVGSGIVLLSIVFFFGTIAANAAGSFYVSSSSIVDMSPGRAGLLMAAGSIVALASRLILGLHADRRPGSLLLRVGLLLAAGACGALLLASAALIPWYLGTVLIFAGASGWPGLMHLAVARLWRDATARATAAVSTGAYLGGVLGPVSFGFVAEGAGFRVAWLMIGGAALSACAVALFARRRIRSVRSASARPAPAAP